ncbi:MAG TPA: hypothetical protein VMV10_06690, partial [Pirellulales bacterium]|nr:hypothetical protein [Pirellulales bacterium]
MAADEARDGLPGKESRKTTKSTTEYRKTDHETHEVARSGGYERRVVTSETRETSTSHSETVEIRSAALPAPSADWHANAPGTVRLSVRDVLPESCAEAALFDGDYLLDLVDRHADG